MSDNKETVKLIIEIPTERYNRIVKVPPRCVGFNEAVEDRTIFLKAIRNGTPLNTVKAEIKKKCDCIDDIARANIYQVYPYREILDLLSEILTSIDNAESEEI